MSGAKASALLSIKSCSLLSIKSCWSNFLRSFTVQYNQFFDSSKIVICTNYIIQIPSLRTKIFSCTRRLHLSRMPPLILPVEACGRPSFSRSVHPHSHRPRSCCSGRRCAASSTVLSPLQSSGGITQCKYSCVFSHCNQMVNRLITKLTTAQLLHLAKTVHTIF